MPKIRYTEQYIIDKTTPREYYGKKQSTYGEMISKYTFEWIFNKSFPTQYPEFLGNMELDGLNAELKIAFEHQGPWHDMNFCQWKYETSLKDDYKLEMCQENDIILFQIPCINKGDKNIKRGVEFILKNLDDKNITTRFDEMLPSEFLNEKNAFIQKLLKISFIKENNDKYFIKPNIQSIWDENYEIKCQGLGGDKSYYQWVLQNLYKLMFYKRVWLEKYYKKKLIDFTKEQINEQILRSVYFWKTSRDFKKSNTGGYTTWYKYPKIELNKEQEIEMAWQIVYQQYFLK
jgi:hypothetical protein